MDDSQLLLDSSFLFYLFVCYCKCTFITFAASLSERKRYCGRRRPCVRVWGCVWVCVCVCVCHAAMPSRDYTPQCRVSLGGEGNALYPVLSSSFFVVFAVCGFYLTVFACFRCHSTILRWTEMLIDTAADITTTLYNVTRTVIIRIMQQDGA